MKTFDDLVFTKHKILTDTPKEILDTTLKDFKGSIQALIVFDNNESISVIFGKMFYSNGIDTYEAWSSLEEEPQGYLSREEVTELMIRTQKGS